MPVAKLTGVEVAIGAEPVITVLAVLVAGSIGLTALVGDVACIVELPVVGTAVESKSPSSGLSGLVMLFLFDGECFNAM